MAKIRDRNPKDSSGAYGRVFGNIKLGKLISMVHGTSISNGNELERLIVGKLPKIPDLDEFLALDVMPNGIFLATKQQMKKCKTLDCRNAEPDFLIFKRKDGIQTCFVVELKDGHVFDTKKAGAERNVLHDFTQQNGQHIPFVFQNFICCFNITSKEQAYHGLKRKISKDEILTGREFCDLLEIDYDEIVRTRTTDQEDNFRYFLEQLLTIPEVSSELKNVKKSKIIS